MKKNLNQLLALLAFLFIAHTSIAQDDSSYLDLGRIKLRKDLTQQVTIKARDLEQMPFASLADAIQPWLQGRLGDNFNTVFVVDGNLVNDVDAWSIYDIEEITLVQNALVQINGSQKNQQLVLVKTKRKETAQQGMTIAGSSFLVNRNLSDFPEFEKESNFYHQYHIAAWQKGNSIHYGLSANFLRDVNPAMHDGSIKINTPSQTNQFRFNGWMNWQIADGHLLSAQLNYSPQVAKENYNAAEPVQGEYHYRGRQSLWNPSLRLFNRIAKGLTSELDASFVTSRAPINRNWYGNDGMDQLMDGLQKESNLLIRERISYTKNFGDWQLEPTLGFSARIFDRAYNYNYTWTNNNQVTSVYHVAFKLEDEVYTLTPALSISKGNSFYFQGGINTNPGEETNVAGKGVFPFASFSLDLLRIAKAGNPFSLQLFGSYTRSGNFGDYYYSQGDVVYPPGSQGPQPVLVPFGTILSNPYPQDPTLSALQAGMRFSSPEGRLTINYTFENRKYPDLMYFTSPTPTGYDYIGSWQDFSYTSHRLGINAVVFHNKTGEWRTGINATAAKYDAGNVPLSGAGVFTVYGNDGKTLVTGGWTNRIRLLDFTFGLDILYLFNEQTPLTPVDNWRIDSWRINNIYAGYHLTVAKNKPLEVYISSRNFYENKKSNLPDNRQFYGAGFKLQF